MTVNLFVSHSACCLNWGHLRQIYNPLCFRCFGNSVAHFPNGPQWTFPLFHQICVCQLDFWPFSLESCPRPCSLIPGQFCAWVWSLSHPTIEVGSSRARSCLCFLKVTLCWNLSLLVCFVWLNLFLPAWQVLPGHFIGEWHTTMTSKLHFQTQYILVTFFSIFNFQFLNFPPIRMQEWGGHPGSALVRSHKPQSVSRFAQCQPSIS